ncbi:unnamed protein product [Urochloa decumbens]|uniref:WPP domain-associated protein n=1 Tax=Urochloa decumbens TaxID=240449 RepID=A0ABC9F4Z4_9POAL
MDAFFSGLDSRLRVPVKAADSIMVGLVNAAMEDAYRKSLWKDGDLDRLFHKLRFAELAVMQLDWCLRFVRAEMDAAGDDGHEQLLDDLIETRDRIQASLDEAERAVAEADRDYTRRKRPEPAGPSRVREAAAAPSSAAGRRGGADEDEEEDTDGGGRAFGEMRGSVSRAMSRMRARLEDASSTLAALMERMSGEASPMARLQEAGHEGEGVKGLSDFYSVAQLLMEFQEMVLDAGAVRDAAASSFDAMERSVAALRADMDEQRWLVDAEREMYGCIVERFLREISVGSDRTPSPGEGSRPPTLQHDSYHATENINLEELKSPKDETKQMQSARHITAEESDSRQRYHSEDQCIHREEFERLAEEKIDSDVRSELQYVLYTAAFRDLVRKLAVQACDVQKVTEERDEVGIRSELQNEICRTIVKVYLKEVAADHLSKSFIKDEVHAVFLAKTLNAWKNTIEIAHSERVIDEEIGRIVFGGLTKDLISGHNFRLIKSFGENSLRNNLGRFSMIDNSIEQLQNVKTQINVATEDEGPDSDQNGVPVKQAEMSTDKDDVSDSVKNNVEEGLEDKRKAQTGEIDTCFSMPPENGNKEMSIPPNKFQAMFMDFAAVICGKLGTAVLRLRGLDKQLANLAEQVRSLKKSELIYRTAFTRRCCDLQTAEAEVDLLGDEVELLLGLLSKTYKALDHYSPVLHHYLGIREMLSMLGKELALRHQVQ